MYRTLWLDTETVGLNGPLMRIQYAIDDGPIKFIDYPEWAGCGELLKSLANQNVLLVAYNASFDVYHLYRWMHECAHTLPLDSEERPVKPFACRVLDLQIPCLLNGPFKNFAFSKGKARSVARVRRIPRKAAEIVRSKVLASIQPHVPNEFKIVTGEHEVKGKPDQVTLSFSVEGRATLKAHARYYGAPTISLPDVWPLMDRELEKPWLPYYDPAVYEDTKQKCLQILADPNSAFHTYCRLDLHFLRLVAAELMTKLGLTDITQLVDHHSDCVHAVAYTRYHGFKVDREVLERTRTYYENRVRQAEEALAGVDLKSSKQRLEKLRTVDPLVGSSKRAVLEVLAKSDRPSAKIAGAMLDFGKYRQRLLQVEKVLECATGRAHPDLRVMGTATGRMSGTSGINWQGIAQAEKDEQGRLVGLRAAMIAEAVGDWSQFEVILGAKVFEDQAMYEDLDKGIDAHCMNLVLMHPRSKKEGWTYEYVRAKVKAHDKEFVNLRKNIKPASFGLQYFCSAPKVAEVLGVSLEEGERALAGFYSRYSGFAAYRARVEKEVMTADTENWTPESVSRMNAKVVDLTGYEMSWEFEKVVADSLWRLGGDGLKTGLSGTVVRTAEKGPQTIDNAIRSALLGSAIAIQAAVARQKGNARVQASGANIHKKLQAMVWNEFRIPTLGIHDEAVIPELIVSYEQVQKLVSKFTEEWAKVVPRLKFDMNQTERWSDK